MLEAAQPRRSAWQRGASECFVPHDEASLTRLSLAPACLPAKPCHVLMLNTLVAPACSSLASSVSSSVTSAHLLKVAPLVALVRVSASSAASLLVAPACHPESSFMVASAPALVACSPMAYAHSSTPLTQSGEASARGLLASPPGNLEFCDLDDGRPLHALQLWACMLMGSLVGWRRRFAKSARRHHRPRAKHGLHVGLTCLVWYSMLLCIEASDNVPELYAVEQHVSSHRRALQTVVSDVTGLINALSDASVHHIVIAAGHYGLSAELNVNRSVLIEAMVAGSVVLDAQANVSSRRRVLSIRSLSVVQLIGLNITGGYLNAVSAQNGSLPLGR